VILIDTLARIEFLRDSGSSVCNRLSRGVEGEPPRSPFGVRDVLGGAAMKVAAVSLLSMALAAPAIPSAASAETILLRASRILDGRGGVLQDSEIVVREGLIADIVPRGAGSGEKVYDLTAMAVLPGYIDTHVHISRHFDPDGKLHAPEDREELGHITLHGAENAYRTLMSGVTTVQSLGSEEDFELKAGSRAARFPVRACSRPLERFARERDRRKRFARTCATGRPPEPMSSRFLLRRAFVSAA
jgi:hypothetical protein